MHLTFSKFSADSPFLTKQYVMEVPSSMIQLIGWIFFLCGLIALYHSSALPIHWLGLDLKFLIALQLYDTINTKKVM